jgi:hypothetical protein
MYTCDKQDKFIELRAQGWAFNHIASDLHISKRTLMEWNREFASDIQSLRAASLELVQDKVIASREEELNRMLQLQKDINDELASRSLSIIPTEKLFEVASDLRKEIKEMLLEQSAEKASKEASPIFLDRGNGPAEACNRSTKLDSRSDDAVPIQAVSGFSSNGHASPALNGNASPTGSKPQDLSSPVPQSSPPQPAATASVQVKDAKTVSAAGQNAQEVCLNCGADLPPLLPNGLQPSHYCVCGKPLSLPGFNLREACLKCGTALPIHGYNTNRPSDICPSCGVTLPPLDPKGVPCWLPEHMRANLNRPKK